MSTCTSPPARRPVVRRFRVPVGRPTAVAASPEPGAPVVMFLPARNEAPRLGAVIERIPRSIGGRDVIPLVVDDGSDDATSAIAGALGVEVVRHHAGAGLGAAVRTGLARAVELGAGAVAFCDADGEYDPAELASVVDPILDGRADYVIGSRFAGGTRGMLVHRQIGNRLLTAWVRWMVRLPVTDGQSGFRALSGSAAASVRVAHDYNYAQVLTIDAVARGFRYAEVPISYRFRTSGRSFVRVGTYLRRVVPTVLRQLAVIDTSVPSRRPVAPTHPPTIGVFS